MAKAFKFLLYLVLTLVLIIIISAVAITQFVNPNQFKEPLQNQLTDLTGRNTQIAGDLGWQFYPWLGFGVDNISIENAEGFSSDPFAEVAKIVFSVKLMPLFSGNIDIGTITVDGLALNLEVNQQENNNWDDIVEQSSNENYNSTNTTNNSEITAEKNGFFKINTLHIAEVNFKNGRVSINDTSTQQHFILDNINLRSNEIAFNQAFPLTLSFDIDTKQQNKNLLSGSVDIAGNITLDQKILQSVNTDVLAAIDLTGEINIRPLQVDKLHINQVQSGITIHDNIVKLEPIVASLYHGRAKAQLQADFTSSTPQFALQQSLSGVKAGPLFNDLVGTDRITGDAALNFNVKTKGKMTDDLIQNLHGNGDFSFHNGAVEGLDLSFLFDWASAIFQREPQPKEKSTHATAFGDLTGSATIEKGIIRNTDLLLASPIYQVKGTGMIDLNKQYLEYRLNAELLNLSESNIISKMQQVIGGALPIIVRGSFANIHAEPDIDIIVKSSARTFLEEQLENVIGTKQRNNNQSESETPSETPIDQAKELLEHIFDE